MYEKIEECPLCQFSSHSNYIIVDDHSISKESFAIVQCNKCSFIYTNPRPDLNSIGKYYESDEYISHANQANNLINFVYKIARIYTLNWKYRQIRKFQSQGSLLDFGCGTGEFLQYMSQKGWETSGVEPNSHARDASRLKGLEVEASLPKDSKDRVDIITAWHVIEHVHDLVDTVRALRKRLKEGGKLILALPNCQSHDAIHYGQHWAGYDVPRHLYHFTQDSIKTLCTKTKLKLEDTIPMKLDAYYVSMLSEKYLGNKHAFIQGLKKGYTSNQKAKRDNNYSSLIYVLTK